MRLPLATTLRNRQNTLSKDARLLNAVVDSKQRVVKRPSLVATYGPVAAGPGQSLFVRTVPALGGVTEELIAISNGVINTSPGAFTNPTHVLVTVNQGGDTYGYSSSGNGSLTPNTVNGNLVVELQSDGTNTKITISGAPAQDFFMSLTSGATTLNTADATFTPAGTAIWQWDGVVLFNAEATYQLIII